MVRWFSRFFARTAPRFRIARFADSNRMAAIHAQGFAIGWDRAGIETMFGEGHVADVACRPAALGEAVIGFAVSRVVLDEAELLTIALDPSVRGEGIGRALLDFHAARLRRAGAASIFLEVAADNAAALALYRRAGFVQIGRRNGYYPPAGGGAGRRDALTMRLDIAHLDPTPRAF